MHWAEIDLVRQLLRTTRGKKAEERLQEIRSRLPDMHANLWPGEPLPGAFFKQKFASKTLSDAAGDQSGENVYVAKVSVPTSVAMSMVLWGFYNPKRQKQDRALAVDLFRRWVAALLAKCSPVQLWLRPAGSRADSMQLVTLCSDGSVPQGAVWTRDAFNTCQMDWAAKSLVPLDQLGLTSVPEKPHVCDIVSFGLQPEVNLECRRLLCPMALSIMAQIAQALDAHAIELSEEDMGPAKFSNFKNSAVEHLAVVNRSCKAAMHLLHVNAARRSLEKMLLFVGRIYKQYFSYEKIQEQHSPSPRAFLVPGRPRPTTP